MAIIRAGSLDDFSAVVTARERAVLPVLCGLDRFSVLRETTRSVQPVPIEFERSDSRRGLALKSLKLTEGFEGFLQGLLNPTNEVYFLSWAWDLSGKPIVQYPGAGATAQDCIIPLGVGKVRELLGAGIVLFPARTITAGLAVRIQLWESDQGARDFGKAMSEVANTIKASDLSNLLELTSMATGVTGTTIALIAEASLELAKAIGKILQANSDDYVDFYEGYFPAADEWSKGHETYQGYASEITLTRLT